MNIKNIVNRFGGQTALARKIGKGQTTVSHWVKTGIVPAKWQPILLELARDEGIPLSAEDFIGEIDSSKKQGAPNIIIDINGLDKKQIVLGAPQQSLELFHIEKQATIDGIEMGVLENGVPYLTESGLARMCGIARPVLNRLAVNWADEKTKPRGSAIAQLLEQSSFYEDTLFLKSELNGSEINAYIEPVCLALLEYYAFIVDEPRPDAVRAFRSLARITFRKFIYDAVGYAPEHSVIDKWRHFHDRVDMTHDAAPIGYWGVFREIAVMVVPMIRSGIMISDRVVPDISVGRAWSEFWTEHKLDDRYGERKRYDHEYPDYYPQARSNPQPAFAYPNASLGLFRDWLQQNYILTKFPKYLIGQSRKGSISADTATKAIEAFSGKAIQHKPG